MDINAQDVSLDLIGAMHDTDKSSSGNDFLRHYDRLFRDFRHLSFNMIEIGVERGGSVATWYDYFTKATIIGVDIKQSCLQFQRDRIIVEIGSQEDPGFLSDLVRRYPPHIIIDDGSHLAHHIIFTFERLFPSLTAGGIYIVEDLHFHAGAFLKTSQGYSEINPFYYFTTLSRAITLGEQTPELQWGLQGYLRNHIDEMTFFGRALAIRKRAAMAEAADRTAEIIRIAERAGTIEAWERAARYLRANGSGDAAIEAVRKAILIDPSARLYLQLSELLLSTGDRTAALAAVQFALGQPGAPSEIGNCFEHYGDLLKIESKLDEAVKAYRDALPLSGHQVVRDRIDSKITAIVGSTTG